MLDIGLPPTLTAEIDGEIALLRLSRPHKRNALDLATIQGLHRFFAHLPSGVRAVVLSGEGEHFCAGLDLEDVVEPDDILEVIHHSQTWHQAFHEIQFGRVPVVAALHGAVVGGGFELAAATHIRVAEPSTYYALPEGQRGIFLGGGGSVRIPRLIGVPLVQDLMLTGRTLSAEEGRVHGASQYLVGAGEGLAHATKLARKIARNAEMTNFAVLHALPRIAASDPAAGFFTESLMAAIAAGTPEAQQRLRDFLEKRAGKVKPGL
ncbi:enoyl-CoA hydratase [Rhodoplanes elegans]|uniref:Enoyl-CoA hydratase n=1 Tax=Rhodoplanes elegans TaxID=29408 RepID=A0A327KT82_9BRAD|nr:crotonase/enoyl-CoA hydratase family protein [Rhodoplanes elegans]MBK5960445.1 enoyl-CoA hydratase [Rhodoplanes elegans]RAI42120.1 enoyl-CoA hydratase [Rhodoplanes elegans]